jgi:transposase
MRILAIDLGKFKSVFCDYSCDDPATAVWGSVATTPQALHDLLVDRSPQRLVFEVSHVAGWVCDLAAALGVAVQVANPNHEGWRWRQVKRKTDRDDALKLAKLSAMGQLPTVRIPGRAVRQWRSLITYRHKLVARRTAVRNAVRALLDSQGLRHLSGPAGWSLKAVRRLREQSRPLDQCEADDLWRGQLQLELAMLDHLQPLIEQVEQKLDALADADARVRRLQSIPGVGPRLGELVVAWVDDPHRFASGAQVGAYAGLTPRQHQSGQHDHLGRITRQGPGLLRKLLVEIAWGMRRHNAAAAAVYERLCKGQRSRRKVAAVGLARRVLIWCWALLRDGTRWEASRIGPPHASAATPAPPAAAG